MSGYTMYVVFDAQTSRRLYSVSPLLEFVKLSLNDGFDFYSSFPKKAELDLDEIGNLVEQERDRAIKERASALNLNFGKNNLNISLGIDIINQNLFVVTVYSKEFPLDKELRFQTVRDLVNFCNNAYKAFAPDYGYGITTPEFQSIEASNIQLLPTIVFDLNYFGPELVSRLGAGKLLSCPTWHTEIFDDGGILLELSADPIEQAEDFRDNYDETANILGVMKTRFGDILDSLNGS
jgi:hypothetical protein